MNRRVFLPGLLTTVLAAAAPAAALEAPTLQQGRALFESARLGSSGRSCATCHPGGRGLEEISAYSDQELKGIINACVRDALQGDPFDSEAQELNSLLRYLRSLQGG